MMTKLKNHFLRFLLSHTSVYLKDQELLLSDDEKLDLFKQIFRSIKQSETMFKKQTIEKAR